MGMGLTEAFELYKLNVIDFRGQSKKTEESTYTVLHSLIDYLGDIDITTLSFAMVRDWKASLDKRCSPRTVRGYVIKLRQVLAYLRINGVDVLDTAHIPIPDRGDERIPSYITREQVSLLIDSSRRLRTKAIISLLYSSGIRLNELIKLNRNDIKDRVFSTVSKRGNPRPCFVDDRTHELLTAYLETRTDKHPALFVSTQGLCRLTPTNVQLMVTTARNNSGIIEKVTPHTIRHSFATDLLKNKANLRYVQVMLGHKSIQTTQIYTHVVDLDLYRVYAESHKV